MKTAKRTLAVLLACLMVFGSFGVVGSAKGNSSTTIAPSTTMKPPMASGTVTYGLDIYKDGTKLSGGETLSPGDVVEVQLCFGTDFYLGLLNTQVYYDSNYFEPYLDGEAYTANVANSFQLDAQFIQTLEETAPTAVTVDGRTVTLFDTITPVEQNGMQDFVNKGGNATAVKQWTPLAWRVFNSKGQQLASNDVDDAHKTLNYIGLALKCDATSSTGGNEIIVPYAPYFSFQLRVKEGADSNGETTPIFVPIDAAKRETGQTCNKLYATECPDGVYASKGLPACGQGFDLTNADVDFIIGEAQHEHTYGAPEWTWADDYSSATATFTCTDNDDTQTVTDSAPAMTEVKAATCTDDQVVTYTATVEFGGETYTDTTEEVTVAGTATDHTYGEPEWVWADDYSSATATFSCKEGDDAQRVTDSAPATDEVKPANCTDDQVVTYTATVTFGGETYTVTTEEITVEGTAKGHTWAEDLEYIDEDTHGITCTICGAVKDDSVEAHDYSIEAGIVKEATVTEPGVKTVECSGCHHQKDVEYELDHEHEYGEPTWEWADDYSSVTATFTCTAGDDVQTVTTTEIDVEELEEAECGKDQVVQYLASVEFGDELYEVTSDPITVEGTALEHSYGDPTWEWAEDYSTATATFVCSNCGDKQVIDATIETTTVSEQNCTTDGVVTYTATATFNDTDYTDAKENIKIADATGHTYGEPEWAWADDYSAATATFTCEEGDDTQTVNAETIDMTVVSELDCVTDKVVTYTATVNFDGETYTVSTEEITLEKAAGHQWADDLEYLDENTHGITCTVCGTVKEDSVAAHDYSIEVSVTKEPTETESGEKIVECSGCHHQKTVEILPLSHTHTYGEPTFEWADDYSSVTATFTCTAGDDTQTVTITDITFEEIEEAECGKDQVVQYLASVEFDGVTYEITSDPVAKEGTALEHTYGEPEWAWADDYSSATATFTCEHGDDTQTVDAVIETTTVSEQGCTTDGVVTYTATATFNGTDYTDTKENIKIADATGHSYGEPDWTWTDDHSDATATFTCGNCGDVKTEVADIDTTVVSELDCTTDKVVTYTATVTFDGKDYTDTTDPITLETATGHQWADEVSYIDEDTHGIVCDVCGAVKEGTEAQHDYSIEVAVIKEATANEPGLKTVECADCHDQKDVEYTAEHEHEYGEPTFEWADDYSSVTATFTCKEGDDTQTVTTTQIDVEELEEAECEKDQVVQYLASVEFNGETYDVTSDPVTVDNTATGHDYGDPVWTWADDYSSATATFTCGNCGDEQTLTATITTNKVSDLSCTTDEVVTYTATVEFGGETYTDTTDEITLNTATGHTYGDPVWTWADDYTSATATFTCKEGDDTQTVTATITTNKVSDLSCTTDEVVTYTATVDFGGETYTDTTDEVTLNTATGHTYGDPVWTWADDYSSATATFTCKEGDDTQTVTATITTNKVSDLSCTTDEVVTYTATVEFGGKTYTDTTDEVTLNTATGHTYGDPVWTWADDYSSATATFTCKEGDDTQVITATIDKTVVSEQGCTTDEIVTYTATATFEGKEYTDTKENIKIADATGHDWSEPVWTWNEDYTEATATLTCGNCGETITVTDTAPVKTVVTPADSTNDEVVTYTATVTVDGKEYTNTTDEITVPGTATGEEEELQLTAFDAKGNQIGEPGNRISVTAPYTRRGNVAVALEANKEIVEWKTSKPKLLTVDENGNVSFVRLCVFCRTATITAIDADGNEATCVVKIKLKWWQYIIFLLFGCLWY